MGFEVRNIDLSDMARAGKEGVRFDVSNVADKKDSPLAGVTSAQRNRNRHIGDVLNIGAGTRCTRGLRQTYGIQLRPSR